MPQIYFFTFFGQNINVHTISLNTINQVIYVKTINMWKNYYRHYECNFCKGIFCSHKLQKRSISLKTGNKKTNWTQSTHWQLVNLTRLKQSLKKNVRTYFEGLKKGRHCLVSSLIFFIFRLVNLAQMIIFAL